MSADEVAIDREDGVTVFRFPEAADPLSARVRAALLQVLRDDAAGVSGIVLTAAGRGALPGLTQEDAAKPPTLAALCQAVEDCAVPVVAVLAGESSGPGAELALAATARIAAADLRLVFADVMLGLCPAAGASQRLPHLIGAEAALHLLLHGRAVAARDALELGVVDGLTDGDAIAAAIRLAKALAEGKRLPRHRPDPAAWLDAVRTARRGPIARTPVGARIIDCVEAALLLPHENGHAFEAVARTDLEQSPESVALRAVARAESRAAVLPAEVAREIARPVDRIGLVGAGPGLAELAVKALLRGVSVTWALQQTAALAARTAEIEALLRQADRGLPKPDVLPISRFQAVVDRSALADAALIIDAAPAEFAGAGANTVRLVLGGAVGAMGLALLPSGKVVELSYSGGHAPAAVATAALLLRQIGVMPVLVRDRPGIGARMQRAAERAVQWIAAGGVPERTIVQALDGFGAKAPALRSVPAGAPRPMEADEILRRWLGAQANEGLRLLGEGRARQASDIDLILVSGFGFPRWQGGPMHWADGQGLMVVRRDLRDWASDDPIWEPAPMLDGLIRDGRRLTALVR